MTGHRFCLQLYLNGDFDTCDKYLSLFVVLLQNDDKENPTWPFSWPIVLRLVNHSAANDHVRVLQPDVHSPCFQRPVGCQMNRAVGFKQFESLENIEQNQHLFIKNNRMIIEIEIDVSNRYSLEGSPIYDSPNDEGRIATAGEEDNYVDLTALICDHQHQ